MTASTADRVLTFGLGRNSRPNILSKVGIRRGQFINQKRDGCNGIAIGGVIGILCLLDGYTTGGLEAHVD